MKKASVSFTNLLNSNTDESIATLKECLQTLLAKTPATPDEITNSINKLREIIDDKNKVLQWGSSTKTQNNAVKQLVTAIEAAVHIGDNELLKWLVTHPTVLSFLQLPAFSFHTTTIRLCVAIEKAATKEDRTALEILLDSPCITNTLIYNSQFPSDSISGFLDILLHIAGTVSTPTLAYFINHPSFADVATVAAQLKSKNNVTLSLEDRLPSLLDAAIAKGRTENLFLFLTHRYWKDKALAQLPDCLVKAVQYRDSLVVQYLLEDKEMKTLWNTWQGSASHNQYATLWTKTLEWAVTNHDIEMLTYLVESTDFRALLQPLSDTAFVISTALSNALTKAIALGNMDSATLLLHNEVAHKIWETNEFTQQRRLNALLEGLTAAASQSRDTIVKACLDDKSIVTLFLATKETRAMAAKGLTAMLCKMIKVNPETALAFLKKQLVIDLLTFDPGLATELHKTLMDAIALYERSSTRSVVILFLNNTTIQKLNNSSQEALLYTVTAVHAIMELK